VEGPEDPLLPELQAASEPMRATAVPMETTVRHVRRGRPDGAVMDAI
jgi:hypothetical protein